MNDVLDTRRNRLAEARDVFAQMRSLLNRIMEDDEIPCHIGMDLGDEIDAVLKRAARISF